MQQRAIRTIAACVLAAFGYAVPAQAQQPQWTAPPPPPISVISAEPPANSRSASDFESATLYATTAAFGLGMGIWIDAELGLRDPALLLISPALLGVAAPVTAYALNRPTLPRGVPGAISTGLLIGAGEGLGIASLQMVTSERPWGFKGLGRAMAIGATAGGVAGFAVGELQRPSPNISAFAASGVVWGTVIGSAVGLGTSETGIGWRRSNNATARGGWIGFNAGLVVTTGLSMLFVPTVDQLKAMWIGGGVGAMLSLPVYLFYLGDGPPAKRGLVFSATAATLGIVVAGVFGHLLGYLGSALPESRWASIDYVAPVPLERGFGFRLGGTLY
ncbi:MAG: hypothetical protein RL685_2501 [Pseudomonadota bacterium]|jgi:hypothetical protein